MNMVHCEQGWYHGNNNQMIPITSTISSDVKVMQVKVSWKTH